MFPILLRCSSSNAYHNRFSLNSFKTWHLKTVEWLDTAALLPATASFHPTATLRTKLPVRSHNFLPRRKAFSGPLSLTVNTLWPHVCVTSTECGIAHHRHRHHRRHRPPHRLHPQLSLSPLTHRHPTSPTPSTELFRSGILGYFCFPTSPQRPFCAGRGGVVRCRLAPRSTPQ